MFFYYIYGTYHVLVDLLIWCSSGGSWLRAAKCGRCVVKRECDCVKLRDEIAKTTQTTYPHQCLHQSITNTKMNTGQKTSQSNAYNFVLNRVHFNDKKIYDFSRTYQDHQKVFQNLLEDSKAANV